MQVLQTQSSCDCPCRRSFGYIGLRFVVKGRDAVTPQYILTRVTRGKVQQPITVNFRHCSAGIRNVDFDAVTWVTDVRNTKLRGRVALKATRILVFDHIGFVLFRFRCVTVRASAIL
jgi:hypothetical protein